MTPGGPGRGSERSYALFTDEHLGRLTNIAEADRESLFERKPHLSVYRRRVLLVALCQGAALYYLERLHGETPTKGVKDLDVYTFYAEDPKIRWPYRRPACADFGESEFGHRPADGPHHGKKLAGRRVDLLGRALPVDPDADAVEAVRSWLSTSRNKTPRRLRQKAVVGLYPRRYQGRIIWDPYSEGYR